MTTEVAELVLEEPAGAVAEGEALDEFMAGGDMQVEQVEPCMINTGEDVAMCRKLQE